MAGVRCANRVRIPAKNWAEYGELAVLFFFQSMATGMWMVPLSRVLAAHSFPWLAPYAFATSAVPALVVTELIRTIFLVPPFT